MSKMNYARPVFKTKGKTVDSSDQIWDDIVDQHRILYLKMLEEILVIKPGDAFAVSLRNQILRNKKTLSKKQVSVLKKIYKKVSAAELDLQEKFWKDIKDSALKKLKSEKNTPTKKEIDDAYTFAKENSEGHKRSVFLKSIVKHYESKKRLTMRQIVAVRNIKTNNCDLPKKLILASKLAFQILKVDPSNKIVLDLQSEFNKSKYLTDKQISKLQKIHAFVLMKKSGGSKINPKPKPLLKISKPSPNIDSSTIIRKKPRSEEKA